MSTLDQLIDDEHTGIDKIAAHLDSLDADTRWREVEQLGRKRQRKLYAKAAHAAPIDHAHFVGDAKPREEVIHEGINTLPVPRPLRRFQKRFSRPDTGASRLFGYNEGPTRRWIGPGFFVAVPTAGRPEWEARGAIVVDYFQIPDGAVPAGWPKVIPNTQGLQMFVYNKTRDFMRRVSTHVTIGAAYKEEKSLDHYFILCRQA